MGDLTTLMIIGRYKSIFKSDDKYMLQIIIKNEDDCVMTIPIYVNEHFYDMIQDHCKENALMGIKGRISCDSNGICIIVTKITVLSSKE